MKIACRFLAILTLAVLLVLPPPASAATVLALSLENLTERADLVVRGVATGVQTHRDTRGAIVRSVSYRVDEYISGKEKPEITIRLLGGELDGIGRLVPGEIDLTVGEETILFLEKHKAQKNIYRVVGLCQGRFNIVRDSKTNELFVSRPIGNIKMVGNPKYDLYNLGQNRTPVSMKLSVFIEAIKDFCSDR